jgi:hypothetical protein
VPDVTFTASEVGKLRKAYEDAKEEGKEVFEFGGNEYVADYAKYLLEYLEGKVKEDR